MGCLHDPLLRPPRAKGSVRPPGRRGGASRAVLKRLLLVAILLWVAGGSTADADTVTLDQYRARLREVRALVQNSRNATGATRTRLLGEARTLLRQTTELRLPNGTVAIEDTPLSDMLDTTGGPERALAFIDSYLTTADRIAERRIDPAVADQRLRELAGGVSAEGGTNVLAIIVAFFAARLAELFAGLQGSGMDFRFLAYGPLLIGTLGAAVILFIVATLGRGLRERVRREIVLASRGASGRDDPALHLRRADAALTEGDAREAIRELFLYALGALTAREAFAYDPALTDRELLARATAIANADAFRDLMAMYERAWFGLRQPAATDARRARELALRVAG